MVASGKANLSARAGLIKSDVAQHQQPSESALTGVAGESHIALASYHLQVEPKFSSAVLTTQASGMHDPLPYTHSASERLRVA